jgi:phosphoserine aminotransferase
MTRVFNFSAGPAILPLEVLEQVRDELLDWGGSGMSVMEMSHRDKYFMAIAEQSEKDLREVLAVPANYKVLFMQGGASAQFSAVPMNLLAGKTSADYIVNGVWGVKAAKECQRYGKANIAAQPAVFDHVPPRETWSLDPNAAYVHYTPNETIEGVEFMSVPEVGAVPLVADYSSTFLSRPIDVSKFGLIYAGAQKNAGPAGVTFVIVREDLLGHALPITPSVFDYKAVADNDSMLNTPSCFAWYVSGLVFKWLKAQGGLVEIGRRNERKARLLYDYLDSQDFYSNHVNKADRSWMNVVFRLADESLNADFLKAAAVAGFPGLKGHRIVGGMRASMYNAMPEAGVAALVDYLKEFARTRG